MEILGKVDVSQMADIEILWGISGYYPTKHFLLNVLSGFLVALMAAVAVHFKNDKGASVNYLIMEDFSGNPIPFVFPRRVDHCDMREQLPYGQVISCGMVELRPEGFACSGGNAELGLKARPVEDVAVLAEALRPRQA